MPTRRTAAALSLTNILTFTALAETKEDTTGTMLEDLLDRYIEAWNSGDAKAVLPFFADSIVYEDVALGETKTAEELNHYRLAPVGLSSWLSIYRSMMSSVTAPLVVQK